jgi:hypothetical protein
MPPPRASSQTGDGTAVRIVRPIAVRDYGVSRSRKVSPFAELGTSGLRQWSGWIFDEFLAELQGRDAAWRYREFMDNDPVAGGFLFMIEMLAQRVTYSVEGGEPRWRKHVEQCHPAGTRVRLADGSQVPIEALRVGHRVVSHDGTAHRVTEVLARQYAGDIYELRRTGGRLTATAEHPLYIARRPADWWTREGSRGGGGNRRLEGLRYEWASAESVAVGDFLLEPVPAVEALPDGQEVFSYVRSPQGMPARGPDAVQSSPDLARLCGYFVADGCTDQRGIFITFGPDEQAYVRDVQGLVRSIFGVEAKESPSPNSRARIVRFNSVIAARFFASCGHLAPGKEAPEWITRGSEDVVRNFLVGYWRGDGTLGPKGFCFTSVSEVLIEQVRVMLLRLGIVGALTRLTKRPAGTYGKTYMPRLDLWVQGGFGAALGRVLGVGFESRGRNQAFIHNGYIHYPIKAIEKTKAEDLAVYNCEVAGTHSYLANGVASHNCMHDMSHGWDDFVCESLTHLPYGYAFMEEVFKKRNGEQPGQDEMSEDTPSTEEPQHPASSVYDDGLVGWRKLPLRAQETTLRWDFDGYSSLRALIQLDWHGEQHAIPITKGVLIRNRRVRNSPEGFSILRRAWTSYFRMRGLQDIEATGAARDLAGIPYAKPPPNVDLYSAENADLYNTVRELVTTIHRDEDEGIVYPSAEWDIGLMSAAGSRQFDLDKVIRRYEQRIAASVAADFMLLGQDGLGSYAMVDVKSELFGMAVDAMIEQILKPMNRYAIPRLLKLNGVKTTDPPKIVATTAGRIDLEKVGLFLGSLAGAGLELPKDPAFLKQMFEAAGLGSNFTFPPQKAKAAESAKPKPGEGEKAKLQKAEGVVEVARALADRALVLAGQFDREITGALHELGARASSAYLATAPETLPNSKREIRSLAAATLRVVKVADWTRQRLAPLLENHRERVKRDTERTLTDQMGLDMTTGDSLRKTEAMHMSARDIEPQVRASLVRSIEEGRDRRETPALVAARIRRAVPAGRFTRAGAPYRSRLISADQTNDMQRAACLNAYTASPHVTAIRVRHGMYGDGDSNSGCAERDGELMPVADAPKADHPQCSVGFEPVVQTEEE